MNEKSSKFDLLRITGLQPKKRVIDKKYASFNRRMMAATIDSLFILILVGPLVEYAFTVMYGPPPLDYYELQAEMRTMESQEEATRLFWQRMVESGFIQRWINNSLVQMAVMCMLTALCWMKWSTTPGKMLLGMKIVDAKTEQPMQLHHIVLRIGGYFISATFFCIGFFWIGIDKRRQAWHDKLADTVVIRVPWRAKSGFATAGPSDSPAPSKEE